MSQTHFIIDIDHTIADNTHRQAFLQRRCALCLQQEMYGGQDNVCGVCGGTTFSIPQSAWDSFMDPALVLLDRPVPEAQRVVKHLRLSGTPFTYLTGRSEDLREATELWLTKHFNFEPSEVTLLMRGPAEDGWSASRYKKSKFLEFKNTTFPEGIDLPSFIFCEDDPFIFSTYAEYGTVLHCPEAWSTLMPAGSPLENEPDWRR